MILNHLALFAGLAVLVFAADHFVLGASRVAGELNMPSVVIGAVVIGFGTSLPEMVVSIIAASGGDLDLGVGNIVGSNVANLGLVLGVAALIATMSISKTTLRREIPLALGATCLFAVLYVDGVVERWEGIVMLVALVAAVLFLIRSGMTEALEETDGDVLLAAEVGRTIGGLIGVVIGAQLVVTGATGLADQWGLSGGFVGFSMVALGTSLPELVTTFACARRGETGLIIGNLFGSNLFNSLAVGGGMGLVGPGLVGDDLLTSWGIGAMLTVSLIAYVLCERSKVIRRGDGIVLVALYLGTMLILGLGAGDGDGDDHVDALRRDTLPIVAPR